MCVLGGFSELYVQQSLQKHCDRIFTKFQLKTSERAFQSFCVEVINTPPLTHTHTHTYHPTHMHKPNHMLCILGITTECALNCYSNKNMV